MVLKAPSAMKFALGENPKKAYNGKEETPATRMAIASVIREQLMKAKRYQQDLQKSKEDEDTDPPEFDMKCEALLPVLERKIKAHFHAHRADDICTAIRIAKEFDLDAVIIHCPKATWSRKPCMTAAMPPQLVPSSPPEPNQSYAIKSVITPLDYPKPAFLSLLIPMHLFFQSTCWLLPLR